MKKYKIGYTQGTFDMFHIGHLNLLHQAKELCEELIVGVNSDRLVGEYKHKIPVVNEQDRVAIVRELRCVNRVVLCDTLKKADAWERLHFDAIFIGNDWKGNERWKQTEIALKPLGAEVVYLRHTDGVSSSLLREKEDNKIED
ncbi:MAG: adenylyltransferase/cytidyltransferase family protein [Bacteroidaceae bacterium]|nr:adenylyltransferase/cytidyltransferase family protein [Bacteroidaceae bacterium]